MNLSARQKSLIERIINCFETGTPEGKYGAISIYNDGPHHVLQVTYGRSQTTEYGNLRRLVARYAEAAGTFSNDLKPYVDLIGRTPLVLDENFKDLLRKAGNEDPVMRQVQDAFFEDAYFKPAMAWADSHQFTLALSALVIYDSFIHSGRILPVIRQRFEEKPPSSGGEEKAWITAYTRERQEWLSEHSLAVVRASTYRTKDLNREILKGNWDLSRLPIFANGTPVEPAQ